jgi:membrane-associated phospholipid phosphatase
MNKKSIFIFAAVYIIIMGFLALGDFDFSFSLAIINPDSIWANFFNLFGEMPANLLVLAGITILFGARIKEVLWRNVISHILALPFMALVSWFIVYLPIQYSFENHSTGLAEGMPGYWKIISIILGLLLFAFALFFQKKISDEKLKEMKKAGILFIVLVLGEVILVNIVKIVWGRPRMRIIESADQFRKWFIIDTPALNNDYKSFPSGHTANGFAAIGFSVLLPYLSNLSKKKVMAFGLIWGSFVALSRVVLGAHFLSDVITGGYITIFLFIFLQSVMGVKKK